MSGNDVSICSNGNATSLAAQQIQAGDRISAPEAAAKQGEELVLR
jgi:hypothetical protein